MTKPPKLFVGVKLYDALKERFKDARVYWDALESDYKGALARASDELTVLRGREAMYSNRVLELGQLTADLAKELRAAYTTTLAVGEVTKTEVHLPDTRQMDLLDHGGEADAPKSPIEPGHPRHIDSEGGGYDDPSIAQQDRHG